MENDFIDRVRQKQTQHEERSRAQMIEYQAKQIARLERQIANLRMVNATLLQAMERMGLDE